MDLERAVAERYGAAAKVAEPGLCCPVDYDPQYLKAIPAAVLDKDYGCGDPVSHVEPGEDVLDLGSGAGKVCFIAAQIVGASGSVLGIDINDEMLTTARSAQAEVARRIGYANVTFAKARIEDLALDLDFLDNHLRRHPVGTLQQLAELEALSDRLRHDSTLVPDNSIDVVISNCVLNLVMTNRKQTMFTEIARVLRPGGRAVISDIVADIDVPEAMRADPDLWSGCYSGALREDRFLAGFTEAGMVGVTILKREPKEWETVQDVEFRSVTVVAYKPTTAAPVTGHAAALYRGPFATAVTDTGVRLPRGHIVPVGPDDLRTLATGAYSDHIVVLEADSGPGDPHMTSSSPAVAEQPAVSAGSVRYRTVTDPAACCGPKGECGC
jgi:arsenite methyltransferase